MSITPGVYRHYKGKIYMVGGIAKHSETLEDMVMYRAMYNDETFGPYAFWVRPLSMFLDEIQMDGFTVQRFTRLSEEESLDLLTKEVLATKEK